MDINCTDKCNYQNEGKCTLMEIKPFSSSHSKSSFIESDCLYFRKKIKR